MTQKPHFDSLEDTANLIAQQRGEAGCFIITKHYDGSYSFGTSGMNGDAVRYGLNLGIYYSFIFEEMERTGREH
ncbi:hypothetical protein Cva_01640 [Caedimonas varicaedens]|uniref:Uncharacterized protein n=1 Tax=Caedimonas varicaedens TaxID=1629334 RepID=A0A0K8MEN5_9PROT|nr:hypothetical protein Cva_01640 [Caedimonas varicaedens]